MRLADENLDKVLCVDMPTSMDFDSILLLIGSCPNNDSMKIMETRQQCRKLLEDLSALCIARGMRLESERRKP